VKAVVQFKGREMQHTQIGVQLLQRLTEDLADYGSADGPPKLSGNRMELYVTPKSKK
jgi:translation initiation factor IF-3